MAFLDLPAEYSDPQRSRYVVLPIGYEGTVSYEAGTADAPEAIIAASCQVELFDEELGGEFYEPGIATHPPIESADTPAEQIDRVRKVAEPIFRDGKFPLALGGEHSVTVGMVRAAAEVMDDISVLILDAHGDLRDEYEGEKLSHACVAARVLASTDKLCQVGIRSYSREEYEAHPERVRSFITPALLESDPNWIARALDMLGGRVYVSVDIDALDPSIAPGTGTPEPGGLAWKQVLQLLREVCSKREVVGADVMEVRPLPPSRLTEFVAARLAYKIIAYSQQS
ncbi:MAG: agmatinase [Phycisphaerae bacterium]